VKEPANSTAWAVPVVPATLCIVILLVSCGAREEVNGDPTELIARGWEYLTIQEFGRAAAHFAAALEQCEPGGREDALALYGIGCSAMFRRPEPDVATAKVYYGRAVEEDRSGEIAPWAAVALARADFVFRGSRDLTVELMTDEALREAYRAVIRDYPGTHAAQEATIHLSQSLFASRRDEETEAAVRLLEELLASEPQSPYRYGIYGSLAGYCYHEERYLDQYDYMVKQIEVSVDPDRYRADNYYRIGYHADARLGRADLAIPYYERILSEYPIDPRSYQVQSAIARLREATATSRPATPENGRHGEG